MTNQENIMAIDTLTKSLAFVQELTEIGKLDPSDLQSPIVPKYSYKKQMVSGDLRNIIEDKLKELVSKL